VILLAFLVAAFVLAIPMEIYRDHQILASDRQSLSNGNTKLQNALGRTKALGVGEELPAGKIADGVEHHALYVTTWIGDVSLNGITVTILYVGELPDSSVCHGLLSNSPAGIVLISYVGVAPGVVNRQHLVS